MQQGRGVIDALERLLGAPVTFRELNHKPGRRRTMRARGPRGTAIVKSYTSDRAPVVARRVALLAEGPPEPIVPALLGFAADRQAVILSDIPGRPLREALLQGDVAACDRAGRAIGEWHSAWTGVSPPLLHEHTARREIDTLLQRAAQAPAEVAEAVESASMELGDEWPCTTLVHCDLYEEQILVGDRIGLIDVDDLAIGPPELDMGNLLAHIHLLERREAAAVGGGVKAIQDGYKATGPLLDSGLLDRCVRLALLRLSCRTGDQWLARAAIQRATS